MKFADEISPANIKQLGHRTQASNRKKIHYYRFFSLRHDSFSLPPANRSVCNLQHHHHKPSRAQLRLKRSSYSFTELCMDFIYFLIS